MKKKTCKKMGIIVMIMAMAYHEFKENVDNGCQGHTFSFLNYTETTTYEDEKG